MSYNPQRKPVVAVARELVSHGFVTIQRGIQADLGQDTARYYSTDLREEEDVNSSFRKIRHELGSVQVLVYNAGARRVNGRSILDTTAEEFESFTKINLLGAFWSTKCVLPDMLEAGRGGQSSIRGRRARGAAYLA
ncbi:hypothetical protein J3459_017644 [Metarhizium acridum]|uniref:uncharacterized protein n=1 Tax=Metarhizium acridum TaxID=92637 RepID=UPI001C6C5E40|nr:hypothetical protein J3459_017644 [Metarhizium acridum]KAG8411714.1 hypothetical protein J3458_015301 [Metarhizium acridum]